MAVTTQQSIIILEEASYHHRAMIARLKQGQSATNVIEAVIQLIQAAIDYYLAVIFLRSATGERTILIEAIEFRLGTSFNAGTLTDDDLVDILIILIQNCRSSVQIGCLMDLALNGDLASYDSVKDALQIRLVALIQAQIPNFDDTGKTLADLWNNAPNYPYDRVGVAQYAINQSRANFEDNINGVFTYPSGLASNFTLPLDVGSTFQYSFLTHTQGATGSALFISESLYFGGQLKMKTDDTTGTGCATDDLSENNLIWFVCQPSGATNLESTQTWRDHRFLMPYFHETMQVPELTTNLGNSLEQRKQDTIFFIHPDDINLASPSSQPPSAFTQDSLSRYMDFENGGVWKTGFETQGKDYLFGRFEDEGLRNIQTGDYMYFNLGGSTSGHGLLIVGWGDAVSSADGLNIYEGIHNFSKERKVRTVPYVADFAYGEDSSGQVGWLQDVRPRPFYSCLASISGLQLDAQLQNLKNTTNGFDPLTVSEYEERLRNNDWGLFTFLGGGLPNFQFFRFPDHVIIKSGDLVSES